MAKRDPHDVLGVERGASPSTIKAAWRRLARQHHPDLTGDDPAASRVATRLMAEINDAYAALTRADGRNGSGAGPGSADAEFDGAPPRRGGPPRPKPTRPVTGRVDTSQTFRPRNTTTTSAPPLAGQPPPRSDRSRREPLRASHPTGPLERDRIRGFRPPPRPALEEAQAFVVPFGKFHGHRLDEIAAFEPSYIDWLARAVQRDPDLTVAARVMQDDLDQRGIVRRTHPTPERPGRPAWHYDAGPQKRDRPPIPEGDRGANKGCISAAAPTVHQACWPKEPVTRLVTETRDRLCRTSSTQRPCLDP